MGIFVGHCITLIDFAQIFEYGKNKFENLFSKILSNSVKIQNSISVSTGNKQLWGELWGKIDNSEYLNSISYILRINYIRVKLAIPCAGA